MRPVPTGWKPVPRHAHREGSMSSRAPLGLDDVRRAWEARDPALVRLAVALAEQPDPPPAAPPREGAMTFDRFIAEVRTKAFHKKPAPEQAHIRVEALKAIESPTAEVPLTD